MRMATQYPCRQLLWCDCLAAAVNGTALLFLSGLIAPLLGLPRAVVVFNGLVNLTYGAFSFSLARQPSPPPDRVRTLVAANFGWVAVCLVMAFYFARPGSWLGAGYLLSEGFLVGVLATLEARTCALDTRR